MLVTASHNQRFTLLAPLCNVPAGATGQLKRPDSYHATLVFDNRDHEDLVYDITDPDPEARAAMQPLHTVGPSMTDPPRVRDIAAAALIAFMVGWLFLPQPSVAWNLEAFVIGISSD